MNSYPSVEMQSVYYTAPADRALVDEVLPLSRVAVSVSTTQADRAKLK